jgi:peptide-methionine (S)-S-oxide reductase
MWVKCGIAAMGLMAAFVNQEVQAQMDLKSKKAAFAAGCFWGVEKILLKLEGVVSSEVGYMGGKTPNPTYEQVCTGRTGHAETVLVEYDPSRIRYEELLITFFKYHDPTTLNRQGPDIGSQYRSVIFFYDPEQVEGLWVSDRDRDRRRP